MEQAGSHVPLPALLPRTHPEVKVYLASLAKGYGIDTVAQRLEELGFTDYLIEIGGDLFANGRNAKGDFWRVGVEKPSRFDGEIEEIVEAPEVEVSRDLVYIPLIEGINLSAIS